MKKWFCVGLLCFLVAGCSSSGKENRVVCSGISDDVETKVVLYFDEEDQLIRMSADGLMEASSEEEAKEFAELNEDAMAYLGDGMSMDVKVNGKKVTISIDADLKQMIEEGQISEDELGMDLSKEEMIKYFEETDLSCK